MTNTCMAFLAEQGGRVRAERAQRETLAHRLGIDLDRLNRLLTASALRPGIEWRLSGG